MTYEQMKHLPPGDSNRACGGHPQTCETMLQVLREPEQRQVKPGRPSALSLADQLCMTLQDWRAYRTSFHIGLPWGLDESGVCRTVHQIANLLINSQVFHVPGKKKWCAEGTAFAVMVVAGVESPVDRPQKTSGTPPAGKRSLRPRTPNSSWRTRPASSSVSPSAKAARTLAKCSSAARWPSRQREC